MLILARTSCVVALLATCSLLAGASPALAQTFEEPRTHWRWIGIQPAGAAPGTACPAPPTPWTVEPMFSGTDVPDSLERFCVYEHTNHCLTDVPSCSCEVGGSCEVASGEIEDLVYSVAGQLEDLQPDQMVVGLAGTSLGSAIEGSLETFFLAQAGSGSGSQDADLPGKPRIAIVDTRASVIANPQGLAGHSPHGDTLSAMASTLLCDEAGGCQAEITSELGLAYVVTAHPNQPTTLQRDPVRGGMVGTIGELAQAIYSAIQRWQTDYGSPASEPLVINLSVAWDGARFGDISLGAGNPEVLSVYRVLQHASCQGVLTVAAAGNRGEGPDPSRSLGPLLPAAWERFAAPSSQTCDSLGSPRDASESADGDQAEPTYRPLLYAVAGIDSTGSPLLNARDASLPPRVAFGGPATVHSPSNTLQMAILNGSSVASLLGSTVGALTWASWPSLEAYQVMDLVDLGGEAPLVGTSLKPDFCQGGTGQSPPCSVARPEVKRLSLCQAEGAASCPAWRNQWPQLGAGTFDDFDQQASYHFSVSGFIGGQSEPRCEAVSHFFPFPPSEVCPERFYDAIQDTPWVFPQPQSVPCPPCTMKSRARSEPSRAEGSGTEPARRQRPHLKSQRPPASWAAKAGDGTLRIEIDPAFADLTLSDPTLTLCPRDPEKRTVYTLGSWPSPQSGDKVLVRDLPDLGCTDATLSFQVGIYEGVGSVTSSILVLP